MSSGSSCLNSDGEIVFSEFLSSSPWYLLGGNHVPDNVERGFDLGINNEGLIGSLHTTCAKGTLKKKKKSWKAQKKPNRGAGGENSLRCWRLTVTHGLYALPLKYDGYMRQLLAPEEMSGCVLGWEWTRKQCSCAWTTLTASNLVWKKWLNSIAVFWVCACHRLYLAFSKEASISLLRQSPEPLIESPCDLKDFRIRQLHV